MNRIKPQGFTLIELLLVLAIISIAFGLGVPSFSNLIERNQRASYQNELLSGIYLARTVAISEQVNVTLCPLDNSQACSRDWSQPIAVFRDPMKRRQIYDESALLRVIPSPSTGTLIGRTSHRRYFEFRPSGLANDAIGHLLWCPPGKDARKAFQIRINMGGRPLIASDSDGNGIVEGSNGRDITCT